MFRRWLGQKLPGLSWELPMSPWVLLFHSLWLYLVASAGTVLIKSIITIVIAVDFARAAAISPNLIDPATSQPIADQMANSISQWVDVRSTTISNSATPATAQTHSIHVGDLCINIWANDGNYVTTSMVYGSSFPASGLLDVIGFSPSPIPIPLPPLSFYREW